MSDLAQRIAALEPDQLARFLRELGPIDPIGPAGAAVQPIRPRPPGGDAVALSCGQERVWFLDQIDPGTPVYNMAAALELSGRLEIAVLAAAVAEVVRRHESLRTRFVAIGGSPRQVVVDGLLPPLPLLDLAGLPAEARRRERRRLADDSAHLRFALDRGPLLCTWLLREDRDRHTLLLTVHHIVSDGWSTAVFMREVATLYAAFAAGRPSPLPRPEIQFPDFALWQRERLEGAARDELAAYWREQLAGVPVLELPADHPRPPVQSHRGGNLYRQIRQPLAAALRRLAAAEGVTLFMTLLAAFDALLCRTSGQEDFCVGTYIANRNRIQLEDLLGFLVNNLALRARVDPAASCRALLRQVRETTTAAYAHQDLPFEALLEALQPARSLSHTPIFQVMLVLQNTPKVKLELPGLTLRRANLGADWANFDLTLWIEEGDGLELRLDYAADLFAAATVARLASHFVTLLAGLAADPSRRVAELPLLTGEERHQLLAEWACAGEPWPLDDLVHRLFERQAASRPAAEAIVYTAAEPAVPYGKLDDAASDLARRLVARGVGPEVVVGLCVEPASAAVVGMLGILKAGGAFLPLDPAYPADRMGFMLADSGARLVVTQERLAARLPAAIPRVLLEGDGAGPPEPPPAQPALPPDGQADPQNLAYVIYTSGSTGRPKGVAVSHRNLLPILLWSRSRFGLNGQTRVLQNLSYGFDFGVFEILTTLLAGGTLVCVDAPRGELDRYAAAAGTLGVDCLHTTPSFCREIAAAGADLSGLAVLHLGGEALDRAAVERLFAAVGEGCRLFNGYGPTEVSVNSCLYEVPRSAGRSPASAVPIGRPTANNATYVLDRWGEPVPAGVPGELCIGGDGVARGYLGHPALTAARFVPDRFGGRPGGRLYRSGDLVRHGADGEITFLGRIDHQVKLRGYRIELEEVEAVLCTHPRVASAVAAVRGEGGRQRLVAYVAAGGEPPAAAELRGLAERSLPAYMVPAAFVFLDALPLTASGKVDRRALPEPEALRTDLSPDHIAPRTPTEEVLAGIWSQVLGVPQVGVHDGFFDLGGHSLLATQIVARVREALAVELSLAAFFERLTVAEQAAYIEEANQPEVPPIQPAPRGVDLPLSFAQERIWFLEQLEPDLLAYYVPRTLRIHGRFDPQLLAGAYTDLRRRHEVLRTTFHAVGGVPVQRIHPPTPFPLPVIDLSALSGAAQEREAARLVAAEGRRRFVFERDFLLRAALLRLDSGEHLLLQTEHHLVHDGWALGVLLRDLLELYAARLTGREPALPPLPVQFADFAVWQRAWLTPEVLERQLAFWRQRLAGAPPLLSLPSDRPRPPLQSFRGAEQVEDLPVAAAEALRALGRREGATLFMTMLAGFAAWLARTSGEVDLVIGSGVANRRRAETEGLLGMMINTLALRLDLGGDPSFQELLRRVREVALAAYAHQDLPFERLVQALQVKRSSSHSPVFQVLFAFNDAPSPHIEAHGLRFEEVVAHNRSAKFDLLVIASPHAEQGTSAASRIRPSAINLALEYSVDLFDDATMTRHLAHFQRLLAAAAADPTRRLSELPLLEPAERQQLLREWSGAEPPRAGWSSLLDLLEEVARERPAAVAVSGGGESLTYRELGCRVDGLAVALRGLGVGPEVRVGVVGGHSLDFVVSLLAVLAAGGVHLPLDPAAPPERWRWMLADAGVGLVLAAGAAAGLPDVPGVRLVDARSLALGALGVIGEPDLGRRASASGVGPDNLAYVMYTSGSTGRPKGVMISHRGLAASAEAMRSAFRLAPGDRVLQIAPSTFDASVLDLLLALGAGATLCVAGAEELADLPATLRRLAITHIFIPPSMLAAAPAGELPDLAGIIFGGEALPRSIADRWTTGRRGRRIYNLYGPTEVTIWATSAPCPPGGGRPPIGRPIAQARAFVLDGAGETSPIGVPGELHLGGVGLARGYLGRPDLTAERFVPDPFCGERGEPGARLYRTGDLVRHLPDGSLDFLGRTDQQIKVHGVRIEPGEIEAAIALHPGVREAVVLATADFESRHLLACVVPAEPGLDLAEVRAFLRARLPAALVPAELVAVDEIPLNRNGKVDRAALLQVVQQRAAAALDTAPPSEVAMAVGEIWRRVLAVERVGAGDDFFALGGHSLLVTRMLSSLRAELGVEVPLRALYDTPTLDAFAVLVEERLLAAVAPDLLTRELQQLAALSDEEVGSLLEGATG